MKERHCDLTIQNKEKELPLHIACQNCSLDVVKLASECDDIVELQTVSGDTPLLIACKRGIPDLIQRCRKMFLIKGAGLLDVLCKAQMCRRSLHWLGGSRGMPLRKIFEKLML